MKRKFVFGLCSVIATGVSLSYTPLLAQESPSREEEERAGDDKGREAKEPPEGNLLAPELKRDVKQMKISEASKACFDCHGESNIAPVTERGKKFNLHIEPQALFGSVHEDIECADCHKGADDETTPHYEGKRRTLLGCGDCHEKAAEEFRTVDIHGKAYKERKLQAPFCNDCHGGHKIYPITSKDSQLSPYNQPNTCGKCHGTEALNEASGITKRKLIERYFSSVHWESVKEGKPAATCAGCHGNHTILPSSDTHSHVTRLNIQNTCSKCHSSIVQTYNKGSHGRSLLRGNHDVPTCVTCHGDHDIISLKMRSGGKRDFAATQVCIWCHGNERIMARYALDTTPVESYMKDFHGLTQRGSAGTSATCADCHDAHHSLPSSHPESRMHISNRGSACGKCHGQSSETFIMSFTHKKYVPSEFGGKINNIVRTLYIILIVVVIGGMLIHNAIVWAYSFRKKLRYQTKHGKIVRMNNFERKWHWLLLISFTILAITGFALKFPDSLIFSWLYSLGMTEPIRAWIHRLCAVIMTFDMSLLVFYMLASRHGKKWYKDIFPAMRDFKEFAETMKFYLGKTKQRPKYKLFNYGEKAEYWALWWGTVIMLATGLILWFPRSLPVDTPAWVIEVARTIHFFEALLAVSAIIVWHFFNTMFHPSEYPMDTSWLTGKLTEEEAKHKFDDEAIAAQLPVKEAEEDESDATHKPKWEESKP